MARAQHFISDVGLHVSRSAHSPQGSASRLPRFQSGTVKAYE